MEKIHSRASRRPKTAGILFAVIAVVLIGLSYFTNFIVFEIDSIIAFIAAIVVISTEQKNIVQVRVVSRLMSSYSKLVNRIFPESIAEWNIYSLRGEKINDVVVLPETYLTQMPSTGNGPAVSAQVDRQVEGLPPLGLDLSELFLRELSIPNPSLEDVIRAVPSVLSERLQLASRVSLLNSEGALKITLANPVLRIPVSSGAKEEDRVGLLCPIGSMLAVLLCYASKHYTKLEVCDYDEPRDILEVSIRFVRKVEGL